MEDISPRNKFVPLENSCGSRNKSHLDFVTQKCVDLCVFDVDKLILLWFWVVVGCIEHHILTVVFAQAVFNFILVVLVLAFVNLRLNRKLKLLGDTLIFVLFSVVVVFSGRAECL